MAGGCGGVGVVRSGSAGGAALSPSLTAHAGTRDMLYIRVLLK